MNDDYKKQEINNLQSELNDTLHKIERLQIPPKPSFISMLIHEIKGVGFWIIVFILCMILLGISNLFFHNSGKALLFSFITSFSVCILFILFKYNKLFTEYKLATTDYPKYIEYLKEQVIEEYNKKFENIKKYGNESSKTNHNTISVYNKTTYIPKCPICQSPNIQKLSTTKRVIHGAVFGLFSKTAKSQWECKNCGNKW